MISVAAQAIKSHQALAGDFINSQKFQALGRHLAGRGDALLPLSQQSGGRRECVWRRKSHSRPGHEPPRHRRSHRTLQLQVGSLAWVFLQFKSPTHVSCCDLMCLRTGWNQESLRMEQDGKRWEDMEVSRGRKEKVLCRLQWSSYCWSTPALFRCFLIFWLIFGSKGPKRQLGSGKRSVLPRHQCVSWCSLSLFPHLQGTLHHSWKRCCFHHTWKPGYLGGQRWTQLSRTGALPSWFSCRTHQQRQFFNHSSNVSQHKAAFGT